MALVRVPLLCAMVLIAGCAQLAVSPPSPPLAAPVMDAVKHYSWSPYKWKEGVVFTYVTDSTMETSTGDNDQSRITMQLKGLDKTAKGFVRVQMVVDSIELGVLLMDDSGNLQDIMPTRTELAPAFSALVDWMQSPYLRQSLSKPLVIGESVRVELPTGKLRHLMPAEWSSHLTASISFQFTYTGHVRLGSALAAAIRSEIPNILHIPIRGRDRNNQEYRIDNIAGEAVEYYDSTEGFSISRYEVLAGSGIIGGKPFAFRSTTRTTLDTERSRGLRRDGR